MISESARWDRLYASLPDDAFSREDDDDDAVFYGKPRMVSHLDSLALSTVEHVIGSVITESRPVILDLMASWDSHLPPGLDAARVVGLGLNAAELEANERLDERVVHDVNATERLPFDDATFDVVLNTVSVDYLVKPLETFAEVGRVLKPGGLHLVIFSDRMFRTKAVKLWRDATDPERVWLVDDYFRSCGQFEVPRTFVSQGLPRPADDEYAEHGIPSDPVFAVWAEHKGGDPERPARPVPESVSGVRYDPDELARRKAAVKDTLRCPYCEAELEYLPVPDSPFLEWDNDHFYVCFNNRCPYLASGWTEMAFQGNHGYSYRLMYDPQRDRCMPVPEASAYIKRTGSVNPRG